MASNVSSSDFEAPRGQGDCLLFLTSSLQFPRKDPIQSDVGTSGPVTLGTRPGAGVRVYTWQLPMVAPQPMGAGHSEGKFSFLKGPQ